MSLESYAANENILESVETETQALNTIKGIMKRYGISVDRLLRKRDIAGVGKASGFLPECSDVPAWKEHISGEFREEISVLFQQHKFDEIRLEIWNKLAEKSMGRWCPVCSALMVDTLNSLNIRGKK